MKQVYCDGTPKGWVAIWKDRKVVFSPISVNTHNEAEYFAVLKALQSLESYESAEILSDSQIVIRQLTGEYKCLEPRLLEIRNSIFDLVTKRGLDVKYRWIPREENLAGKALAKIGKEKYIIRVFDRGSITVFDVADKSSVEEEKKILDSLRKSRRKDIIAMREG